MPLWVKIILTLAAIAALIAALWIAIMVHALFFSDLRWGPS